MLVAGGNIWKHTKFKLFKSFQVVIKWLWLVQTVLESNILQKEAATIQLVDPWFPIEFPI